ncbi:MAG: GNAT family N-acetyltransferase [Tannerellaceae bacterium]|jgi:GNAT superfamily N-acetyltransferase|nr:GNAT family N-acetyltransferase [Tannerellaceae bacterium]
MKSRKRQILELWRMAFRDTEVFMRLYFNRIYQDENALVIEREGRVISVLQMLPYTMSFCGKEITVAYISGACTLPSEQGKGFMRQLLQEAFVEMQKRNIAVSALIPASRWLFDYYRSQGYTEVFDYSILNYTRYDFMEPKMDPEMNMAIKRSLTEDMLYAYFDRKLRERPSCLLHTPEDFSIILKDLKISGGKLFPAISQEGELVGLAFVLPPSKKQMEAGVLVKEILYDDEKIKKKMLLGITRYYNVDKAICRVPFYNDSKAYPFGMARVIDRERMIALWMDAHPDSPVTAEEMMAMDIQTLTSHLFDYENRTAYMSLMLD